MNSYVNIFRSLCNDSIWTSEKFTRGQAWVDMILRANSKEGHIRKRGIRINLERGQLGYSLKELEQLTILFWENRKQNPTIEMAEA